MFSFIGIATGLVAFAIDMGVTYLSKLKFNNTYKCKYFLKGLSFSTPHFSSYFPVIKISLP